MFKQLERRCQLFSFIKHSLHVIPRNTMRNLMALSFCMVLTLWPTLPQLCPSCVNTWENLSSSLALR